jgi:GrpB-like predicted nucleotidyltransferase (UPF0157 family)
MANNLAEADARFRAGAFRLRLREDLICLRVRYLRRGRPSEGDLQALMQVHTEVLQSLRELRRLHASDHVPGRSAETGLAEYAVEVGAYDPAWPGIYKAESTAIRQALGRYAVAVHHVGSTAIPGMPAKPIVDVAVAVEPNALRSNLPECIGAMRAIGYDYYGDWGHHGGYYFGKSTGTLRTGAAQLHAEGSTDLAELLEFRDAARANPSLLEEYAAIKVALAAVLGRDRGLYVWCKGHWLSDRVAVGVTAWGERILKSQTPTLVQLGFRGIVARLRPRFAGKGLHPMALRRPRQSGT